MPVASAGKETLLTLCKSITAEFDPDGEIRKSFPKRANIFLHRRAGTVQSKALRRERTCVPEALKRASVTGEVQQV